MQLVTTEIDSSNIQEVLTRLHQDLLKPGTPVVLEEFHDTTEKMAVNYKIIFRETYVLPLNEKVESLLEKALHPDNVRKLYPHELPEK